MIFLSPVRSHPSGQLALRRQCRTACRGLTLVEVLAAVAILALVIAVLTPWSLRARTSTLAMERTLAARAALDDAPLPTTAAGEQRLTTPLDCRLRWSTSDLVLAGSAAGATLPGRWLRLQIVTTVNQADVVLAERDVPLLGASR